MSIRKYQIASFTFFFLTAFALLLRLDYVWKWVEELSLFVPGAFFREPFLRNPGGWLAYAGSFLTQFLYYPALGASLFVLLLLAVQQLASRAFRIPPRWMACSFIPPFLLLAAVVNVGYTWATLKAPGHFFAPALGCCVSLSGLWLYRLARPVYLRAVILLSLAATYPFFGFYSLLSAGLCLLHESLAEGSKKARYALLALGCAAIYFFPKIYYYGYAETQQELSRLYVAGLPPFFIREAELMLWLPYLLLFAAFFFFSFFSARKEKPAESRLPFAVSIAAYLSALLFAIFQTYENDSFKAGIQSALAIERQDWQTAAQATASVHRNPTRDVVINRSIALARLGTPQPPRNIPEIPSSYKDSRPGLLTFVQLGGLNMNYYGGQFNMCYRWAMEMSVEFGFRVSYLKFLVKCSLLNGEYELAAKYNNLLKKTLFHRDWAAWAEQFIANPSLIAQEPEFQTLPKDPSSNHFVE